MSEQGTELTAQDILNQLKGFAAPGHVQYLMGQSEFNRLLAGVTQLEAEDAELRRQLEAAQEEVIKWRRIACSWMRTANIDLERALLAEGRRKEAP